MLAGGNKKLRAYWRKHGLLTMPFEEKYLSPEMQRYREELKAQVEAQMKDPSLLPPFVLGNGRAGEDSAEASSSDCRDVEAPARTPTVPSDFRYQRG